MYKMWETINNLADAVDEKKITIVDGIPAKKVDPVRSPSPPTNISADRKPIQRPTV